MVSGSKIAYEKPWTWKSVHGTAGRKKRLKREVWLLSVKRSYIQYTNVCWANVSLEHIVETKKHERAKLVRDVTPLYGWERWNQWGRPDIRIKIPGFGKKTYLHMLMYYHFHAEDDFKSFAEFRRHCTLKGWDVDHGDEGYWRLGSDGVWRTYTNVHILGLLTDSRNRGQAESVRHKYSIAQAKYSKKEICVWK